jgi:peptidoglycan hydrolase CwlO-like protein
METLTLIVVVVAIIAGRSRLKREVKHTEEQIDKWKERTVNFEHELKQSRHYANDLVGRAVDAGNENVRYIKGLENKIEVLEGNIEVLEGIIAENTGMHTHNLRALEIKLTKGNKC